MNTTYEMDEGRWRKIRYYHLMKLEEAKRNKQVDKDIIPLLDTINKVDDFVTRSSCYGRILLLNEEGIPKKGRDIILGKYHRPISLKELEDSIKKVDHGILWMNVESTIVHVGSRSLSRAIELYKIALDSGYKSSSIISSSKRGVTVEILEREKVSIPIYIHNNIFLYSSNFLNNLLKYIESLFYSINIKMNNFIRNYSVYFKL